MIEVVKYIGRDKDEGDYSDAPFDTTAQASRVAYQESRKFPRALFTIEENGQILEYWWQGSKRSEREIGIRRRNHQW